MGERGTQVEIRVAGVADVDAVVALVSELLVELGGEALPRERAATAYAPLARGEAGFALLAEEDGVPVAACTVSFVHALRSLGRYAIIQEMYVSPRRRSGGTGRRVLERALAEARARGCEMVELGTPRAGSRQIAFYERSGFRNVGARLRWQAG